MDIIELDAFSKEDFILLCQKKNISTAVIRFEFCIFKGKLLVQRAIEEKATAGFSLPYFHAMLQT